MIFFVSILLLLILIVGIKTMATQDEILASQEAQRTAIAAIATDVSSISDAVDANPPADLQPIADSVAQTDQALSDLSGQVKTVLSKFPSMSNARRKRESTGSL